MDQAVTFNEASPEYWGTVYEGKDNATEKWIPRLCSDITVNENGTITANALVNNVLTLQEAVLQNALRGNYNDLSALTSRAIWQSLFLDPRARDLYRECGYPDAISPLMYRAMYDREGIAARVVEVWPKETWKQLPEIRESEDEHEETEFEAAIKELDKRVHLWSYLKRADILSGVGSYGVLFLGLDDGEDLNLPVTGINDLGEKDEDIEVTHKLMYLRAFDESCIRVGRWVTDPTNPRYAQPEAYLIRFLDYTTVPIGQTVTDVVTHLVHWTRCVHIADNRKSSEIFGVPRMQRVYNRLLDIRKICGGSAEMFWKGGYPGLSMETQPDVVNPELDAKALRRQMENYQAGLARYLLSEGLTIKTLETNIADPTPAMDLQLDQISIAIEVPKRILMGSEQGELASSQDKGNWNERVTERRIMDTNPFLIEPVLNRLIAISVLPEPEQYIEKWPDPHTPTDDDKASVFLKRMQAMGTYVAQGVKDVVPPLEMLVHEAGFDTETANEILEAAAEQAEMVQEQMDAEAQDQADQEQGMADDAHQKNIELEKVKGQVKQSDQQESGSPGMK